MEERSDRRERSNPAGFFVPGLLPLDTPLVTGIPLALHHGKAPQERGVPLAGLLGGIPEASPTEIRRAGRRARWREGGSARALLGDPLRSHFSGWAFVTYMGPYQMRMDRVSC